MVLREIAHLRPRTNTFRPFSVSRHNMAMAIHSFPRTWLCLCQYTIITGSDCEGAGQMFQVTTLNLYNLKKDEKVLLIIHKTFWQAGEPYCFGQLEGELAALSLGEIYLLVYFSLQNSNSRHAIIRILG